MYQLKMPLKEYEKLKENLLELHPEIVLELVSCDYALTALGFAESPPCVIRVPITGEQMEALMDELNWFDYEASEEPMWSPKGKRALRYAWMSSIFLHAELIE